MPRSADDPEGYLAAIAAALREGSHDALLPTHEQAWLFAAGWHLLPADAPLACWERGRTSREHVTFLLTGPVPAAGRSMVAYRASEPIEVIAMITLRNLRRHEAGGITVRTPGTPGPALVKDAGQQRTAVHGPPAAKPVVMVDRLRKAYGPGVGVMDVSFSVNEGEIFGIIGPNGAGKTTTVECISGMRIPDSGVIDVFGLDPQADRAVIRERVGVQLQESALPPMIKAGEVVELFASFYRQPADPSELLEALGLAAKRNTRFMRLSGGLKQRLSIALALIGNPQIAILDELTTGLDPQARRDTWELIERVRDRGVTVILVTHFMDEAERLCDRVMLVDRGKVAALDTPAGLAERAGGGSHLQFVASAPFPDQVLTVLPEVAEVGHDGQRIRVTGTGDLVSAVIRALGAAGVEARDIQVQSATLDDAYVRLIHHAGHDHQEALRP